MSPARPSRGGRQAGLLHNAMKLVRWMRQGVPLSAFLRGLLVRRHFHTAGVVLALPGGQRPIIKNRGEIHVESCSLESGVRFEVYPGARLSLGKGTYLNRNVHLVVSQSVTIGRRVKIGWDTVIMDTDLHGHLDRPARAKPVVIEDDVWIGCRAVILKGVRVGKGATVGAGAIVTRDVPPGSVVASPSATIVRPGTDESHADAPLSFRP